MMNSVLVMETSSRRSSVAVWKEGNCIFDEHFFSERRQTGPLFSLVERAIGAAGSVDLIAVGTGPGSYNGLRAAIALGEGLALGGGIPCAGWSSLLGFPPQRRVLAGDARSGQFFLAVAENHGFLLEPELLAVGELDSRIASLTEASGAERCWIGENPPGSDWKCSFPCARELGLAAMHQATLRGFATPRALPIYLKPPHITRPAK